jgi:hypothetical protein
MYFLLYIFCRQKRCWLLKNFFLYESLKKAHRRRHFWVVGSSPRKYGFHQSASNKKNRHYTCFFYVVLLCFIHISIIFLIFLFTYLLIISFCSLFIVLFLLLLFKIFKCFVFIFVFLSARGISLTSRASLEFKEFSFFFHDYFWRTVWNSMIFFFE